MKKIITIVLIAIIGFSSIGCELWDDFDPKAPRYSTARKWTDGIVYYKFHDNVDEDCKDIIVDCMIDFEEISSLQFIEDDSKKYFVTIKISTRNRNCVSDIGMYKSTLELASVGFVYIRLIKHELGHAIGLHHEHQREDRNKYVKIVWDNIQKDKYRNFVIVKKDLIPENQFKYDLQSIMHYDNYDFSTNKEQTIKFLNGEIIVFESFDNFNSFSEGDIKKIQYLYTL